MTTKINTPRLNDARPDYSQEQTNQLIKTLELIIRQLNTTYTNPTRNKAEAFAWYNARY